MSNDRLRALSASAASVTTRPSVGDEERIVGRFTVECFDAEGNLKWTDGFNNTVVTVGKNLILDQALAGSAYTASEYMGLISSVSYTAIAAGDTMASHSGWTEAGSTNAPTFTARIVCAWSSASAGAKALSAALSFTMTASGTLKGCFLVGGSGAVSTLMNTSGTLISAGLFTGGDRIVANGDTVNVSYTLSI